MASVEFKMDDGKLLFSCRDERGLLSMNGV